MANDHSPSWTDELLLREIRAGGKRRNTAWEYIYKAWRGYYLSPVMRSGGKPEQVDMILSQVVMDVERQVMKEDFELRAATLRTYFTEAVVRAWARARVNEDEYRSKTPEFDPQIHITSRQDSVEEEFIQQERMQRLDALLAKLGEKCRTILTRFAMGYTMREIAEELGFASEQSAKNAKGKCHRNLLELTDEL